MRTRIYLHGTVTRETWRAAHASGPLGRKTHILCREWSSTQSSFPPRNAKFLQTTHRTSSSQMLPCPSQFDPAYPLLHWLKWSPFPLSRVAHQRDERAQCALPYVVALLPSCDCMIDNSLSSVKLEQFSSSRSRVISAWWTNSKLAGVSEWTTHQLLVKRLKAIHGLWGIMNQGQRKQPWAQ